MVARLRAAGCVFAEEEAAELLAAATGPAHLASLLDRRVAGEPLELVLGWTAFCGLRVAVEPGVFVPRQRTALLVERAVALLRDAPRTPLVVDLCCGSGAVGLAVATVLGPVELHAADVDPVAVRCARRNLAGVGGRVHQGDLYAALPEGLRGRVDLLAVNAPYVPSAAIASMPPEARDAEPRTALDGGPDGTEILLHDSSEAPDEIMGEAEQTLLSHALTAACAPDPDARRDQRAGQPNVLGWATWYLTTWGGSTKTQLSAELGTSVRNMNVHADRVERALKDRLTELSE